MTAPGPDQLRQQFAAVLGPLRGAGLNPTDVADALLPVVLAYGRACAADALDAAAAEGDTRGLDRTADHIAGWLRDRAATLRAQQVTP